MAAVENKLFISAKPKMVKRDNGVKVEPNDSDGFIDNELVCIGNIRFDGDFCEG